MEDISVSIRPANASDHPFILSSWLQSYRDTSSFAQEIPKDVYFKWHQKIVENILNRESATVLIACMPEDETVIFGYAAFENSIEGSAIHFVYVKRAFNGWGICTRLFAAAPFEVRQGVFATHLTNKGKILLEKYGLTYCPYLI